MEKSIFFFFLINFFGFCAARYMCKNPSGQDVDWWVVYKAPSIPTAAKPISLGYGHYYMDGTMSAFVQSTVSLVTTSGHAVAETLKNLYAAQQSTGEVFISMYNDEWPSVAGQADQTTFTYGHTKGDVVTDKDGGFWLIHSVPKFPPADAYQWVSTARKYGQSMLCISFNYDQLPEIAAQLRYNQPWSYYTKLTPGIEADVPDTRKIINLDFVTAAPLARTSCLVSQGGVQFTHFAKTGTWKQDIFYHAIAPTFNQKLYAETWINGGTNLPAWCGGSFEVLNITSINMPDGVTFTTDTDHSKWAVAEDCSNPLTCIGDINRQYGQYSRGGGLACFTNPTVCAAYRALVGNSLGCGSADPPAPVINPMPTVDHQCAAAQPDPKCALYNTASFKAYWCKYNPALIVSKCPGYCS